jgi:hypothetical protein
VDEQKVLREANDAFRRVLDRMVVPPTGSRMPRLLVLGDPVVSLGAETLIPDGGLVIEDAAIVRPGRGRRWRPWAPSTGSSVRPGTSCCPGS